MVSFNGCLDNDLVSGNGGVVSGELHCSWLICIIYRPTI